MLLNTDNGSPLHPVSTTAHQIVVLIPLWSCFKIDVIFFMSLKVGDISARLQTEEINHARKVFQVY